MTERARRLAGTECPRCGSPALKYNGVGAWCESFPCRWHIRWATIRAAVEVMRKAGFLK